MAVLLLTSYTPAALLPCNNYIFIFCNMLQKKNEWLQTITARCWPNHNAEVAQQCSLFVFLYYRCGGVSLAVRGCGLNRFLPPIILKVCVCVRKRACVRKCGHVYVLSVQVSKCTFTLSYTHTCILPKLTQSVCRTPNHDYKLKCEELFFFFCFGCYFVLYMYILSPFFSWFFTRWRNTRELYVLPQIGTSHTAKRYSCGGGGGDLNKHKLNLRFVPNCFMKFSIWHLSKLLYMRGTFIVRDCLCVWAIIF